MVTDNQITKPDRYHLMTSFRDAIALITDGMPKETEEISPQNKEDAINALTQARAIMEKHPDMESFSVFPFFEHLALNEEQTEKVMKALVGHRVATCHKLVEIPVAIMERIFGDDKVLPGIPYPLALRALHLAYHQFQYKGPSVSQQLQATVVEL